MRGDQLESDSIIQSVAIGDVKIGRLNRRHIARLEEVEDSWIQKSHAVLGMNWEHYSMHLNPFTALEEVILVGLEVKDKEDVRVGLEFDPAPGSSYILPKEATKRLFVAMFEEDLLRNPAQSSLTKVSKWWDNPRLTVATNEEFEARFR